MKKMYVTIIALLFFMPVTELSAFVNQRQEWWKIRLKGLIEEQKILEKKTGYDPVLKVLVADEIKRAESMLGIFEQNAGNDSSLSHEKKVFSEAEIGDQTRQTAPPLCSLFFLGHIINTPGETGTVIQVRKAAGDILGERAKSAFGPADEAFLKSIMDEDISKTEWQYLCLESIFLHMMESKEDLMRRTLDEIAQKTAVEVSSRKNPMTVIELQNIIISKAPECAAGLLKEFDAGIHADCLNGSWTWQNILERIGTDFDRYKGIQHMLEGAPGETPLTRIRNYYKNPMELERSIFEAAEKRYLEKKGSGSNGFSSPNAGSNTLILTIPRDIDGAMLFKEINTLRKSLASAADGREDEEYFRSLEKKFQGPFEKYCRNAGDIFSAEEEKSRKARDKNSAVIVLNEHDFYTARDLYNEKTGLVRGYILKSIDFIRWVSETRKVDADRFTASFKSRLSLYGKFLGLLRSLTRESAGVAEFKNPPLLRYFASYSKRIDEVTRSIGYSSGIGKNKLRYFSASQIQDIRNRKSEFSDSVKLAHADIASIYLAARKGAAESEQKRSGAAGSIQGKIAQREIQLIMEKIDEYMKAYARFKHAEAAFQSYSAAYNRIQEELGKEDLSGPLENSIKMKSLLPMLNDFNSGKLKMESVTRNYLSREIQRDISKLITLVNYYRQKKVEIKDHPAPGYAETIRTRLKEKPAVSVASWQMNETNFEEIDRKAVEKLSRERNRILWQRHLKKSRPSQAGANRLELPEIKVSLNIPEGWICGEPGSVETDTGVRRTYTSPDKTASLVIARIPLEGRTAQDIAAEWVKESRGEVIKQRWGKRDDTDYFWSLSRGSGGVLLEIYAIYHGDDALLLSGSSPKNKYSLFKTKFDTVFNSLEK